MGLLYYHLIMSAGNLLKNKAYVLPIHTESDDGGIELVRLLLSSIDEPINPIEIKFIATTEDYDVYRYTYRDYFYCIKISLDEDCKKIQHEASCLNKINNLIRPKYIKDGRIKIGDNIRYIITSYEESESIQELGRSFLLENFDSFCEAYGLMQDSEKINMSYKQNISEYFQTSNISELLTEDSINAIKNYTDFSLVKKIMDDMKNELLMLYDESFEQKTFICHGALNAKNIISRNGLFKFINFDNCYSSHCFFDLNELFIELGIPENLEYELLEKFCSNLKIEFNSNTLALYKKCYQISLIKKAIELVTSYLKEIYLYSSERTDIIINIADRFYDSYDRYMSIKHFKDNKDFIFKTLTEPILDQKA
jgi:hypothetical protein